MYLGVIQLNFRLSVFYAHRAQGVQTSVIGYMAWFHKISIYIYIENLYCILIFILVRFIARLRYFGSKLTGEAQLIASTF